MRSLIIYAHPGVQSLNHAIRQIIESELKTTGETYAVRDLYQLNFDPVLHLQDIEGAEHHVVLEDVQEEQMHIQSSDMLIFIFPIWWAAMPAILKGYIDRVFSFDFAYNVDEKGDINGLLKGKKAVIINTAGAHHHEYAKEGMFDTMNKILDKGVFALCGIEVIEHKYLCAVHESSETERIRMLEEIRSMIRKVVAAS